MDANETGSQLHPFLDGMWTSGSVTVRMWPTFFAGVRVR